MKPNDNTCYIMAFWSTDCTNVSGALRLCYLVMSWPLWIMEVHCVLFIGQQSHLPMPVSEHSQVIKGYIPAHMIYFSSWFLKYVSDAVS